MGKRGKQPWSREKLPVGTIRVRQHSKRSAVRMIKIRDDGPPGRRWMALARYWWLHNRGPIPDGMRVVHADGDLLNDDPSNYILASPGDVVFLAGEWDPTMRERNKAAVRIATARCNRERSRVRRSREFFADMWYAVDASNRTVINQPYRSRVELFRSVTGRRETMSANGAGLAGEWLGWPGIGQTEALLLAVLAGKYPCWTPSDQLLSLMEEVRQLHGWNAGVKSNSVWTNGTVPAKRRGWLVVQRRGRRLSAYRLTQAALDARSEPVAYVAARGSEIVKRFMGFKLAWPDGRCVKRRVLICEQSVG